ncbi:MAG TPA: hypothetical protein VGL77_07225, partial [Armatimonadota bacterium]
MEKMLLLLVGVLALFGCATLAAAQAPWELTRGAASFDRHFVVEAKQLENVKTSGTLAGAAGWFDYDVTVPSTGWYEIYLQPYANGIEVLVDGGAYTFCPTGPKVGNFWLTAGKHTIRLQRIHWTGFAPVRGFTVRAATGAIGKTFSVTAMDVHPLLRKGETLRLQIASGARTAATTLTAVVTDARTQAVLASYPVALPAQAGLTTTTLKIPAAQEGSFLVSFKAGETPIAPEDVRPIGYSVVDTRPLARTGGEVKKTLIASIDCAALAPDYTGGGATRVISKPFGKYRESGDVGWLQNMNSTAPSWFAYKVTVPQPQQPYLVEIDYPDDAQRTFCLAVRDSSPGAYPTAGGVDSGGEFTLSNKMLTHTVLHWTQGTDLRVLMITARTGLRAAASKIRVYKLDGPLPLLNVPARGGRSFANWYEEGGSFLGIYATPNGSVDGTLVAADRWARS